MGANGAKRCNDEGQRDVKCAKGANDGAKGGQIVQKAQTMGKRGQRG